VNFAKESCPAGSLLGTAEAITPLLDKPLKGNVYLRSNPAHKLPDLVVDLKGQINLELAARIDTDPKTGGLRTTFESVPDAPVTRFTLSLAGGSKGLLQNSHSLCGRPTKAIVKMAGQNGVTRNTRTKLDVRCRSKASRHGRLNRAIRVLRSGNVAWR
jgi:hypothetical protein